MARQTGVKTFDGAEFDCFPVALLTDNSGHIKTNCVLLHKTHFMLVLPNFERCPILKHYKQHFLFRKNSCFCFKFSFWALKHSLLSYNLSQKTQELFTLFFPIVPEKKLLAVGCIKCWDFSFPWRYSFTKLDFIEQISFQSSISLFIKDNNFFKFFTVPLLEKSFRILPGFLNHTLNIWRFSEYKMPQVEKTVQNQSEVKPIDSRFLRYDSNLSYKLLVLTLFLASVVFWTTSFRSCLS